MDDLLNSCNIISKPSDEELDNGETLEFRYSFAHLERALVTLRSREQTFVYLVFKVLYVKHVKPLSTMMGAEADGDDDHSHQKLTSFLCKNTMLWICERFPPEHVMWANSFDGLTLALEHLFKEMHGCFETGNMPYFFDPQTNVIVSISKELQRRVVVKIEELISSLHQFLCFDMEQEFSVCCQLTKILRSISKVFNEIKRRDFSRIITKQPELLPDIIEYFVKQVDLKKKVEDEVHRVSVRIDKEARRTGQKVEDEVNRVSVRIDKEARRTGQKVEDEVHRVSVRIDKEARRTGQKVEDEVNRASSKIDKEARRTGEKVERETQRIAEQAKDLLKKFRF